MDEIEKYPSADLLLGTLAETITETNGTATIMTDRGPIIARLAFDGRNSPGRHIGSGHLLQHYTGQHVRVQSPVFDPDTMTLMDFDIPQMGGISFVYVLPFSQTEALIEPTIFSKQPRDVPVYTRMIRDYLQSRYGITDYEILFQEQGIIPMTTQKPQRTNAKRIIPIGTAGGMVKGSTGYGFIAIQEMSQRIAAGISAESIEPPIEPRSQLTTILDRIFISYLERRPDAAPKVFYNLFERVPPQHLVPFLADKADLMDIARVVSAMPKLPFIQEAISSMRTKEVSA
jgi:lycopene beta-cyclase